MYKNIYEYEKNGGRKLPSTGSPRWQKQYRTSEKHSKIRVFGSERLKLGSGVGWCEPERWILRTRWSLGAKERP